MSRNPSSWDSESQRCS